MKRPNKKRSPIPRLLKLGGVPVEEIGKLRLYVRACHGYQQGAKSLRKAYRLSCNPDDVSWQQFRDSAARAETIFGYYFDNAVDLFDKLGEGMAWIGLTDHGQLALKLTVEFISWYDETRPLSPLSAR